MVLLRPSALLLAVALTSAPGVAQKSAKPSRPPQFQALIGCRQIEEASARLACFDAQAAALDVAERRSDLVVVDRQQLRSTRRSLFGLSLPRIEFLDGDEEGAPKEFEAVIRSATATRDGKWTLGLDDAVWRTTEVSEFQADPKAGETVRIKRGPLGSFKLSVEGRSAVRALRVR